MQIVYISNRPQILLETIKHVKLWMPFVDKALVCAPDALRADFERSTPLLPLELVSESDILSKSENQIITRLDHQRRNYLLRKKLVKSSRVDARFIMSDDDARPMKEVLPERYFEGGKYKCYYFYELKQWSNNQTEFDAGQIATGAVLAQENFPTLSYASHMPQIIDRALYNEATEFFEKYSTHHPLCEWSSYFNYAVTRHVEQFHTPIPYLTLCWPEHPLAWKRHVQQPEFLFENYTPSLYRNNGLFSEVNLQSGNAVQVAQSNIQKVVLWEKFSIRCLHPEQGKSLSKYLNWRTWVNKLLRHTRL